MHSVVTSGITILKIKFNEEVFSFNVWRVIFGLREAFEVVELFALRGI